MRSDLDDDFVALLDRNHLVASEAAFTLRHLAEIPHVQVTSAPAMTPTL